MSIEMVEPVVDYGQVLDAIAEAVRASKLFKPAARVEPAPGPLSEAWLKKNSLPHGGAFSALAGIAGIERLSNGLHRHTLNLGLYFIPEPGNRKRQAREIASDVSRIIGTISMNRFGLAGARLPEKLRAANRYSAALDEKGSTLWTVDWSQDVLLADQLEGAQRLGLIEESTDGA